MIKNTASFYTSTLLIGLFAWLLFDQVEMASTKDTPGTIEFVGDAGSPNVFTFERWQFTKVEMPDDKVENIQVELEINTSSLSTGWKELESNIRRKKDYFYVKKFPKATVVIDGAQRLADGRYTTEAMLTLKGISKSVKLTFSISETAPYVVKGEGEIVRADFKFTGNGPKPIVPVSFEATLPLP